MAYTHEFGIIDCIETYEEHTYEPQKYNCISINGDLIDEIYPKGFGDKMKELNTFAHNTNRPYKDLAYYGITLIPPSSLLHFQAIILSENKIYNSKQLQSLSDLITLAINQSKWLIHYGI